MLSMTCLASSFSNVTLPNDHGLTGIVLASELNLICLVSGTPLVTSAFPDQVQGRAGGSAKCPGWKWKREEECY